MRNWDDLRIFLSVARHGTVSGAARELSVSHSTVLRRIDQFEVSLESKLFRRRQKGYQLTVEGERLFEDTKSLETTINQIFDKAEATNNSYGERLRISQPELGTLNIYPIYAEFRRLHPEITLEIHSTMKPHNITQQEVDVVLRVAESPPDLLVGRCLGQIKPKAYASKSYLDSLPKNHNASDYHWIVWQNTYDDVFKNWFKSKNIKPNVIMYAEQMPDVIDAIKNGMGVGFLSNHEAEKHNGLVELLDGESIRYFRLWILTHRDLRNNPAVSTFMRFVAERLKLD